jgi:hypothetical protein
MVAIYDKGYSLALKMDSTSDVVRYWTRSFSVAGISIASFSPGCPPTEKAVGSKQSRPESLPAIIDSSPEDLDLEKLKAEQRLLGVALRTNAETIAQKTKEPSRAVQLHTVAEIKVRTVSLIAAANGAVERHNKMVNELPEERSKLTNEVWKYLIEVELKDEIQDYEKAKSDIGKAIRSTEAQIRSEDDATAWHPSRGHSPIARAWPAYPFLTASRTFPMLSSIAAPWTV